MEKLLALLAKIPADKQGHALMGVVIYLIASIALLQFVPVTLVAPQALMVVAAVGAFKEVYDAYHPEKHTCDFWDFIATTSGGLLVFIAVHLYL